MGITVACFSESGKMPWSSDMLMILHRVGIKWCLKDLKIHTEIWELSVFLFLSELMMLEISSKVTGTISISGKLSRYK